MKKWLVALVLTLSLCIVWGVVAYADNPTVTVTIANGALSNGAWSGSYYYKVYVSLSDGSQSVQCGWNTDVTADAPDGSWTENLSDWFSDNGGAYFVTIPDEDVENYQDAFYVRATENSAWTKTVFSYDQEKVATTSNALAVTSGNPSLLEEYTVEWDELSGAEYYMVHWEMPNTFSWRFSSDTNTVTIDDTIYDHRIDNKTGYIGNYQVWVDAFSGGYKYTNLNGVVTLSVSAPEANDVFILSAEGAENGELTIGLHEHVNYQIQAPAGVEHVFFVCGEWPDEVELDAAGYAEYDWSADRDNYEEAYTYTAYAMYQTEDGSVYSNTVRVTVNIDDETLIGTPTFSFPNGNSVARDGLLEITVSNVQNGDFYGAYVEEDDEWIANTGWVDRESGETTTLMLPVAALAPGNYDVHVYATRYGSRHQEADNTAQITVTAPAGENVGDIIFGMKNSFTTGESLRIRAYYTNPNNLEDSWMHVEIHQNDEDGPEFYSEGQGFNFQNDGVCINVAGNYVLKATIFHWIDEENDEKEIITSATHNFTVTSPNGNMASPDVDVTDKAYLGDQIEFTFNQVANAQSYSFWIHQDDNDESIYHAERSTPGTVTINTNRLRGSGVYWIECDVNAPGYEEGHTTVHFALLDRDDSVISNTESLYFTISATEIQTTDEFHIIAYVPGTEEINLYLQRQDWEDPEQVAHRDGPGLSYWSSRGDGGMYTVFIQYRPIEGEWTDLIEVCTLMITNGNGALDNPTVTMADKVYLGTQTLSITFDEVDNAESYSYWIHRDDDYDFLTSGNRESAGSLDIDLGEIPGPGVYWVECDVNARGYEQGHKTVHFAFLDPDVTETGKSKNPQYYFTIEDEEIPTSKAVQFVIYFPGADGVNIFTQKNDEGMEHFEYRDGPGLDGWFGNGGSGTYTIYANACFEGNWIDAFKVCKVTITADNGNLTAPTIIVNGVDHQSNVVHYENENAVNIEIPLVDNASAYYVRMNVLDDGYSFYSETHLPEEGDESISFIIEDGMIKPGRMYEIFCGVNAEGYEGAGTGRAFLLQEEKEATVTLTVDEKEEYWTAEDVTVHAYAEGATAILIRSNNEDHWYQGDTVDDSFNIWSQDVMIYAFATYDPAPADWDNIDWFDFDWSAQSEPVYIYAETNGDTSVPTMEVPQSVVKGDWLEFTINDDGDARQMDVRISDDDGNDYEFRRLYRTGTYVLPTANLEAGKSYKLRLSCVQTRHQWTEGPDYWFDVVAPETDQAFFELNKSEVYVGEPFVPTIYAPGAEAVKIMLGGGQYGYWEGDNGTNNADWEWRMDEAGEHMFYGYAMYANAEDWTEIGTVTLTVNEPTRLDSADIQVETVLDVTQAVYVDIPLVANGNHYILEMHYQGQEDNWLRWEKNADEAENNMLTFTIDANTLLPNRAYWIDCYVDPADMDYAHSMSDSSKSVMTISRNSIDSNIAVSVSGETVQNTDNGIFIPVNSPFEITVSTTENNTATPTAVAVYMGDREHFCFFDTSAVIEDSEYQAWPETIFARAYYGDLSDYNGDWDAVPWSELEWGSPSEGLVVNFTSNGSAEPASVEYPYVTMAGTTNSIILNVTLGEGANEAHANLNRILDEHDEDLVFGDYWIVWEEDEDNPGQGTITIPTNGLDTGRYYLYVDNSGEGRMNSRWKAYIEYVDDPYQVGSKLTMPGSLTEIESEAFAGTNAYAVIIPNSVMTIGSRAFAESDVQLMVIPDGVNVANDILDDTGIWVIYGGDLAEQLAQQYGATFYRLWD